MGDILSIISREAEKRPRYKAFNFNDTKIEQFSDAYRTASWAKDRAKRARRIERWKKGRVRFTEQVQAFGLSRSLFDHGPQISWECTDILGKGAFGLVGLWQQLEADGRVIDVSVFRVDYEMRLRAIPSLSPSKRSKVSRAWDELSNMTVTFYRWRPSP